MLYFFLAYPQETILVKVGEKKAEKDFIGYEFSNRRGHEGIKMYRDENEKLTTKLYDKDNYLNSEKANSYIYRAFLGEQIEVSILLSENIQIRNLKQLISFNSSNLEKRINTSFDKIKFPNKFKYPTKPVISSTDNQLK